jgi:hypothetical protein
MNTGSKKNNRPDISQEEQVSTWESSVCEFFIAECIKHLFPVLHVRISTEDEDRRGIDIVCTNKYAPESPSMMIDVTTNTSDDIKNAKLLHRKYDIKSDLIAIDSVFYVPFVIAINKSSIASVQSKEFLEHGTITPLVQEGVFLQILNQIVQQCDLFSAIYPKYAETYKKIQPLLVDAKILASADK